MNQKDAIEAVKLYESIAFRQKRLKDIQLARTNGSKLRVEITGKNDGYSLGATIIDQHFQFKMGSPNELTTLVLDHIEKEERASLQRHLWRLAQIGCEKPEGVDGV